MQYEFTVKEDQLTAISPMNPYSGSVNVYECRFTFSPSWDDFVKVAIFIGADKSYVQALNDGICTIPYEVIESGNQIISVGLVGTKGDGDTFERCTTNITRMNIGQSAYSKDTFEPITPTPDLWEQYLTLMENAISNCTGSQTEVSSMKSEVSSMRDTVTVNKEIVVQNASEAAQSAQSAAASKQNAAQSEEDAEKSKNQATQALSDLLAMLGTDIATLTNGKLTPSQIPALSINDVFEVDSIADMLTLNAQRGDVALVLIEDDIHDSYMLAVDDPSQEINWKKLGISYVANAGHALTADQATNSEKINGKRMVSMTQSQYDLAVKDENTYYIVVPD